MLTWRLPRGRDRGASARAIALALALLLGASSAFAEVITLTWDPSPGPDVAGYRAYYRVRRSEFWTPIEVSPGNTWIQLDLQPGNTYSFVVTAYGLDGAESTPSNEVFYTPADYSPVPSPTPMATATPPPESDPAESALRHLPRLRADLKT